MILVDCSIGPLFFLHVNVSGGEPCEVQDNVRREPVTTATVDCDGGSMSGAAVETMNNKVMVIHIKLFTSSAEINSHPHGLFHH